MAEKKLNNKSPRQINSEKEIMEEHLSLVTRILNLFKDNSPEAKKKQLLKEIGKILKKQRYKFINVKTEEALPALAKFYYQIYSVTAVPSKLLMGQENAPSLKSIFIDSVLTEKQKELIGQLQKDNVEKRLSESSAELENIKKELAALIQSISNEQMANANRIYKQYLIFIRLIKFDYYFFLKKFDSLLREMEFRYKPVFKHVDCEYVLDGLIEMVSIFPLLLSFPSWNEVFDVLKTFKKQDILSRDDWNKMIRYIGNVYNSEVLQYMIKLVSKDPLYSVPIEGPKENICDEYFSKLKTSVEMIIQKISLEKKNSKKDELLDQIFGNIASANRMKNYTEINNGIFKQKLLGGYLHIEATNYVKAFMLDYVKRDIMKIVNYLVVKAEWKTNASSKELSDSLESLVSLSDKLIQLDNSLGTDSEVGGKINSYLKRMASDPKCKAEVKKVLHEVNSSFVLIAQDTFKNLTKIAQALANILPEFVDKPPMNIIINPAVVKSAYDGGEGNLVEDIKAIYKKIYLFVNLLKTLFAK
ncbi:MAG: DUF5312 domain-containing protein [Spirochaetaceae bacterium]|nr:DUF5312 domain-containing protein [Spirochaetaceae bacterium]